MQQIARFFRDTFHFIGGILRPTGRSLRDNTGLAALSIVLAFGIWIFVTQAESASGTRVVPDFITVEAIHTPDTIAVVKPLPQVQARVTVADYVFDSLTGSDFQATVDLTGKGVGDYDLPVQIEPLTNRGNLQVDAVLPETIKVSLKQLQTSILDVSIDVQGTPVSGYSMGTPVVDDAKVSVSGPEDQVHQVAKVTASINVDGLTDNVDQSVHLTPRDAKGELVEGVTLTPALTGLRIDIEQTKFSRSMAISPVITGVPADGYNVVSVSVNPPVITVRGEQAFIAGTSSVLTKSVDVAGATADVVKTVSLDLASGAEVTGGPPVVTITVKIQPATGLYTFSVPVTVENLGANVSISGALPSVTVVLFGPLPVLEGLSLADIPAVIDLSGDDAGAHQKEVNVTPPSGTTVRSASPTEITITLENR